MRTTVKGEGEPEIAVVYCTHGDETAGKKAVEKLLDENPEFLRPVKFLFANEKAYREGERFIDTDLNRSFPGDPESESYEERIAAEIMEELKEPKVLDLHESTTEPVPFSLFTWMDERTIGTLQAVNAERTVEISYTPGCGINNYGGVEVETGPKGSKESADMMYRILKQFLVNMHTLEGEKNFSEPELYSVYGTQPRKRDDPDISVSNFQSIDEGDEIADGMNASESFVPVLFDENYNNILGFKAVRLEKVEEKIFQQEKLK